VVQQAWRRPQNGSNRLMLMRTNQFTRLTMGPNFGLEGSM